MTEKKKNDYFNWLLDLVDKFVTLWDKLKRSFKTTGAERHQFSVRLDMDEGGAKNDLIKAGLAKEEDKWYPEKTEDSIKKEVEEIAKGLKRNKSSAHKKATHSNTPNNKKQGTAKQV